MKRFAMLAFLLFAFVFVGFSQTDVIIGSGNDETIDDYVTAKRALGYATSHNFGVVEKGSVIEHQFKIVNSSNANMNITDIQAPKGMEVKMTNKTIKGKSKGTFTVVVNTENFDKSFQGEIILKTDKETLKYSVEGTLK